jgi:iron complex outermembrane receptor protein
VKQIPKIVAVAVALLQFATPSMAQSVSDSANKASGAGATSESSASALGEIIVTARRRAENAQTVPITVDVLGPGDFSRAGSFGADQLAQASPALHADAQTGDRNNIVYTIRGQGQTYGTEYPSVIAYFAEVPVAHINTGQYFDLENVQVLKGPQGTLFGRVTDGGAVLIQPKAPTDKFEGFAEVKAGSYNLKGFTGAINAPLIADGVLNVRLAVDINRRKGFTIDSGAGAPGPIPAPGNPGNAGKDEDNVHYDSVRLSVSAKPIEGLHNNTVFSFYKANENGTGVILGRSKRSRLPPMRIPTSQPACATVICRPFRFRSAQPKLLRISRRMTSTTI